MVFLFVYLMFVKKSLFFNCKTQNAFIHRFYRVKVKYALVLFDCIIIMNTTQTMHVWILIPVEYSKSMIYGDNFKRWKCNVVSVIFSGEPNSQMKLNPNVVCTSFEIQWTMVDESFIHFTKCLFFFFSHIQTHTQTRTFYMATHKYRIHIAYLPLWASHFFWCWLPIFWFSSLE